MTNLHLKSQCAKFKQERMFSRLYSQAFLFFACVKPLGYAQNVQNYISRINVLIYFTSVPEELMCQIWAEFKHCVSQNPFQHNLGRWKKIDLRAQTLVHKKASHIFFFILFSKILFDPVYTYNLDLKKI